MSSMEDFFAKVSPGLRADMSHLETALVTGKRPVWAFASSLAWRYMLMSYMRTRFKVEVEGSWQEVYKKHSKLILLANHSSHLDGAVITSSMPFSMWEQLYIVVARDYFFSYPGVSHWSKYCCNAIPFDREEEGADSMELCMNLMKCMDPMWTIIFPEGTRSLTGEIASFKKGVSLMSRYSETPLLYLYIHGGFKLWPKGTLLPKGGEVKLYIGPVQQPSSIRAIESGYRDWVASLDLND